MFFTIPFCSPVSADAPSVLLRSVSTVVEQFFKIRIQQAMTDEVASFSRGAAELNVHRLPAAIVEAMTATIPAMTAITWRFALHRRRVLILDRHRHGATIATATAPLLHPIAAVHRWIIMVF